MRSHTQEERQVLSRAEAAHLHLLSETRPDSGSDPRGLTSRLMEILVLLLSLLCC